MGVGGGLRSMRAQLRFVPLHPEGRVQEAVGMWRKSGILSLEMTLGSHPCVDGAYIQYAIHDHRGCVGLFILSSLWS